MNRIFLIEKGDSNIALTLSGYEFFQLPSFLLRLLLSSWGSVERNVFPEDIPPFFVCYGFPSNENFQDFLQEGVMSLLIR